MTSLATQRALREKRRLDVAELLKGGATRREIAKHLNVSVGTVQSDVNAIRKEWRDETFHAFDDMVLLDIQRLETAISVIWPSVLMGNLNAIRTLAMLLKQKAQLVGYEGIWRAQADHEAGRPPAHDMNMAKLSGESAALLTSLAEMGQDDIDVMLNNLLVARRAPTVIENYAD